MFKSILKRFSAKDAASADHEAYIYKSTDRVDTVLIVVLDVDAALLKDIITTIRRKFGNDHKIVYVTDSGDFTLFRQQGVAFEYLPPLIHQRQHASDMPWQAYLRERWGLLLAKWRPKLVLSYGTNIEAFLNAAPDKPRPEPAS